MKLEVRFDNLDEVRKFYDPAIVERAAYSTVKQLHSKATTAVSKAVRDEYAVNVKTVKGALKPIIRYQNGVPVGYLIYTGKRISLRHFATKSSRVRVKTRRGYRYGAKVKVKKRERAALVPGAFWGRAQGSGELQIFKRMGLSRLKIKKLTAPAIAQMVRNESALDAINELVQREADEKLANNLDHFLKRQIGIR